MKKLILALLIVLLMPLLALAQDFDKNAINLIGNNSALNMTSDILAPYAGTTTPLTTAGTVEVVSTSAQDGVGGTGCVTLTMSGVSSTGAALSETITMDGATAVVSINSYQRVDKLVGLTFGDTVEAAAGTITAYLGSDVYCTIAAGNTESFDNFGTLPATAGVVNIVSSSTSDTSAGVGMRTMLLEGLDADWAAVSETITMNGTTAAVSVNSYIRINKITGKTFGTTGTTVGNIKVYSGYKMYSGILAGQTESQNAIYSVPAGKFAVLKSWSFSALTQPTLFQLKIRPFGGVYSIIDRANITLGAHDKTLDYFVVAPPKSDIAIFANSTTATSIASGSFQLQLKQ